ncbi:hypothetical protein Ahy_A09g042309 [Arachis hypogaea]|uniref:Uncharacterized protein n=1 Tax=Arachis hypogaea TaxID=3818 RepID=A0A445BFH2_ARAHY|nr:hypothetical protein Ahy_A09g042309 [Arachis hypogaea]
MAGMDDYEHQLEDSQDPDPNDAVVPTIEMRTVRSVSVEDGTSSLNLELSMNVKIDAQTVALEGRMSALERLMFQKGKFVTEIQSLLTTQRGSPTASTTISSTVAATMVTHGNVVAETNLTAQRQSRRAVTNDIGSPQEIQKSLEKGKGLVISNVNSFLDIIVSNSPGFEDDVIIDETLSIPCSIKGTNRVPKRSTISGAITHDSVETVCEKDLPSMSKLDCTTKVCELFSLPETYGSPLKIPKLEPIDSKHMLGEEQTDCSKCTTSPQNCQGNVHSSSIQGGSAFKPFGMMNIMEYPGLQMVFRPTVHMDLTCDECKMATYIYGKNDQYLKVLFKFSTFEVSRAGFHSLSPVYMPNVDANTFVFLCAQLMNIILMSVSMRAYCVMPPRVWYTLSVFADDVLAMRPFEVIRRKYMNRWLSATSRLEHVLVLVCELTYTWYLMVVDVKHGRVYCLDVTRAPENT